MKKRRSYYDAEPWYLREKTIDWYQQMPASNNAILKQLQKQINSDSRILEIACGGGGLAAGISEFSPSSYCGIDFSETAIINAKEQNSNNSCFEFHKGDALDPKEYNDDFNLIIAHQFFHCLVGDDRDVFLENCHHVLKATSGKLILTSMYGVPEGLQIDPETRINPPGNRFYAYKDEIIAELENNNFKIQLCNEPEKNIVLFIAIAI